MEFAIVDIETTGGHAAGNSITEVAVFIHNGKRVVDRFETLINPQAHIPYYITALTGISNQMVSRAPVFSSVADKLFGMLNGRVFVAHAVNFDYSFLKNEFKKHGYDLTCRKLCTVRLSRKVFPNLPSYGLGNLCNSLNIPVINRHRAGGDAAATAILFEKILNTNGEAVYRFLKRGSKEQALPPNVPHKEYETLPRSPGVYYFLNKKGKVVYVGKAADIRKRVGSHFSSNSPAKQKGEFMRHVFHIRYTVCADEKVALTLETKEIKRLWPQFNRAQKGYTPQFGIVSYFDQLGFNRMAVKRIVRRNEPHIPVDSLLQGHDILRRVTADFNLCLRLSGIPKKVERCREDFCTCCNSEAGEYNLQVSLAWRQLPLYCQSPVIPDTPPVFSTPPLSLF